MYFRIAASNVVLTLISICVAVILSEIVFRALLFSDYAFMQRFRAPGLYADPMSDDDYWKLYYLFDGKFPPLPSHILYWDGLASFQGKHMSMTKPSTLVGGELFFSMAILSLDVQLYHVFSSFLTVI